MPIVEETNAAANAERQPKRRAPEPPLQAVTDREQVDERGEICIEIVIPGKTGSWLICDIMRGRGINSPELRGRWTQRAMPPGLSVSPESRLGSLPDVPGQCVAIHLSRLYVRIFDPLGDPRNRELLANFNEVWTSTPFSNGRPKQPVPQRVINLRQRTPEQTCDNAATWLYWMQRQVGLWNAKQVTAVLCRNSAAIDVKWPECRLPNGETYVGDPVINFDASAQPGEPRTFSQMIREFERLSKHGEVRTVTV